MDWLPDYRQELTDFQELLLLRLFLFVLNEAPRPSFDAFFLSTRDCYPEVIILDSSSFLNFNVILTPYPPPGSYPAAVYPPPGGYPPPSYPSTGYPPAGYPPSSGYPPAGYPPPSGYPPASYPPDSGYTPAGYPPSGYLAAYPAPHGYPSAPAPYPSMHGHGTGSLLAGGVTAAAAAYGAHRLSHGMFHHGHHKFHHGKFKHSKFGKRWKGGKFKLGKFGKPWKRWK
ncbi:hypothetical protein K1719_045838 [Acacia pycnantha]|nr:hypothetical protein K1719_045838 [Acacia pycnantha]